MKPYRHEPIKTGTTAARELRIDLRPAEELKPNPANARVHSKKQIRQIANSIEAFGFNVPDSCIEASHGSNVLFPQSAAFTLISHQFTLMRQINSLLGL